MDLSHWSFLERYYHVPGPVVSQRDPLCWGLTIGQEVPHLSRQDWTPLAFPRRLPLDLSPAREDHGIPKALLPSRQPQALVLPPGFIEEHRAQDPTQNPTPDI